MAQHIGLPGQPEPESMSPHHPGPNASVTDLVNHFLATRKPGEPETLLATWQDKSLVRAVRENAHNELFRKFPHLFKA